MIKYKQYFQEMIAENQALFDAFQPVHDGYMHDRKAWSARFHEEGKVVVEVIREWERRLCAGMERGQNAVYSSKLAEKFWGEVKQRFPFIERVGVRSNLD
jgi:hypothetical protein